MVQIKETTILFRNLESLNKIIIFEGLELSLQDFLQMVFSALLLMVSVFVEIGGIIHMVVELHFNQNLHNLLLYQKDEGQH